MKDQRKSEIRVGLIVLFGILIFIWILGWAKNFSFNSNEQAVKVRFSNVAGLEIGDQVTVNGMRKGYVKDMKAEVKDVIIELSIDKDIKLKEDASFAISMLDLMGGKKVEVFPGSSSNLLNDKKINDGLFYSDIPAVMSLFGSVQDDLVTVLMDVKITLHSLNKYLTDEKLESDLKKSFANLNELTKRLNIVISENKNDVNQLLKNTIELTKQSNLLIADNKDNIHELFSESKNVLYKSNELLTDLNALTKETQNQQNNFGKLLYDESMIIDLKKTLQQVNKLTSILIEQLQKDGINVDANIF
jgi:phospholipid/cholesterol/gamma-HCH transport system substrate-binding protein